MLDFQTLQKFLLVFIVFSIFGSCKTASKYTKKEFYSKAELSSKDLKKEIDKVVIPIVRFKNVNLTESIAFIVKVGAEAHPVPPFYFPFDVRCELSEDIEISLSEDDIPYSALISIVCSEFGVAWYVENGVVIIK